MLVEHRTNLRFRESIRFSSQEERDSIVEYLDKLPGPVHVFGNSQDAEILMADFHKDDDRATLKKWLEFRECDAA